MSTEEHRKYHREYFRRRYRSDPDFKEKAKEHARKSSKKQLVRRAERRKSDPEYRERKNAKWREYYHQTLKFNPERIEMARERARKRQRNPKYRQQLRENARKHREKYRVLYLVRNAITRCKKTGIECDADYLHTLRNQHPETCPCCNTKMNYAFLGDNGNKPLINGPSLDRVNPTKGYIRGNTEIICWRCNALKRDALLHELESIVAYMKGRL